MAILFSEELVFYPPVQKTEGRAQGGGAKKKVDRTRPIRVRAHQEDLAPRVRVVNETEVFRTVVRWTFFKEKELERLDSKWELVVRGRDDWDITSAQPVTLPNTAPGSFMRVTAEVTT